MSNEIPPETEEQMSPDHSPAKSNAKPSPPELSAVEVLSSDEDGMNGISQVEQNTKKSWLPWRRPNRRDQQLRHLREGYIELLGLVKSISGHLDRQKDEKSQVAALAESLPPALNSFQKLADSQEEVSAILGNLSSQMERTNAKDEQLLQNLEGFNSSLKDVNSSNQRSLGTLDQVSQRIEHSDEQMKMLFEQANQGSQAAGALMMRLEKRVFLSNLALVVLLCLLLLLGAFWVTKQQTQVTPTVITMPAAQVVASPPAAVTAEVEKPLSADRVISEKEPQPLAPAEAKDESREFSEPAKPSPEVPDATLNREEPTNDRIPTAGEKDRKINDLELIDF